MEFKQRYVFELVKYKVSDDGVQQTYKSLSKKFEQTIKYEKIGNEVVKESSKKKGWLIAAIIFSILSISLMFSSLILKDDVNEGIIFWFIVAVLCFIYYFGTSIDRIYLIGTIDLFFFNKKGDLDKIHNLLSLIENNRNKYLKNKYYKIDKDLEPESQIEQLKWLNDQEIITDEEYEDKKNELLNANRTKNSVGFV